MDSPSRKERERERHRLEVLLAAEAVFAEKEYGRPTVQEIADRAEFAVGSLYNFFESKEAIYQELIEMRMREYIAQVQQSIDGCGGAEGKVRALIHAKIRFFQEHERFFRILSHAISGESSEQPQLMSPKCVEMFKDYLQGIECVITEGIKGGVFRDVNPRLMALVLEGATGAVIKDSIVTGKRRLDDTTPRQIEELVLRGILKEGPAR